MKNKKLLVSSSVCLALLVLFVAAYADPSDKLIPYKLLTTVQIPGGLTAFDISWVDSEAGRYYLADRGNAAANPSVPPRIDVIDTKHNAFLFAITGFAGPNGVVAIPNLGDDDEADATGHLWVGDNDSTAKEVDVKTRSIVTSVSTVGTGRADELAFDPADQLILIANDRDNPPFISFISTQTRTVVGKLSFPQAVFGTPTAINHGLEQSVWVGSTGKFYLAVPATSTNPNGEVDEISPSTKMITKVFPTTCNPAGLVSIPDQKLMTSCGDVVDIAKGTVTHISSTVGGDEIWFNPGDRRVYFGGGTDFISVDVVNGVTPFNLITTLTVGLIVPPVPPATFNPASHITHSIAADSELNRIFVPVSHEGVRVYTDDQDNGQGQDNNSQGHHR